MMSLLVQDYILMWLLFLYFDNLLLFKYSIGHSFFVCGGDGDGIVF